MAEMKNGYFWDGKNYYTHDPITRGDVVAYVGNRSSTFEKGQTAIVGQVGSLSP